MPFRYRCEECDFDHFSTALASAHESQRGHTIECYTVDQDDGYSFQGRRIKQ